MSATRIEYTRTVYSILDLLSDVGGLFGALGPICSGIVIAFQHQGAWMFILGDGKVSKDGMSESTEQKVY